MQDKNQGLTSSLKTMSVGLMLVLVACFAVQQIVIVHMGKPYDAYLALSGYGMKSWHLWELFTYQFFHRGSVHLVINLAGLWYVGRAFEAAWGSRRFLLIYVGSILAGGLLQGAVALAGFLLPESQESVAAFLRDRFGGPVVGSSVGLCGVLAAFCALQPDGTVPPFFGVRTKARYLLWGALAVAAALVVIPSNSDLAHLAHLGGLLSGVALVKLWAGRNWKRLERPA